MADQPPDPVPRRVAIINADDFGLSPEVNSAVALGFRQGVLRSASLMMAAPAAGEAVELARSLPGLRVGLHVTLSDGVPLLPPRKIPQLTGPDGRFCLDERQLERRLMVSAAARSQMRAEIAAQFIAFQATGLECDHVNSHRNAHVRPAIALAIFQEARRHGIRAVRIPWDTPAGRLAPGRPMGWLRRIRAALLRRLATHYGLEMPDRAVDQTGRGFDLPELLRALPEGVTEFFLHPATAPEFPGCAPGFPYLLDLAALTDPGLRRAAEGVLADGYQNALQWRSAKESGGEAHT